MITYQNTDSNENSITNERITTMNEDLITIEQAAEILERSPGMVYNKINNHLLDGFSVNGKTMVSKKQVINYKNQRDNKQLSKLYRSPWDDLTLNWEESMKPVEFLHNPNCIKIVEKYKTNKKYAVTNTGRLLNLTNNYEITPSSASHDYGQVDIGCFPIRLHRLVAAMWCPNRLLKSEVHHIDGNIKNNNFQNLIWVTVKQHDIADNMRKEAQKTNQWAEYESYILKLRKENEWHDEYMCLVFEKDNCYVLSWITKKAYLDYKTGKRTLNEIDYTESLTEKVVLKANIVEKLKEKRN